MIHTAAWCGAVARRRLWRWCEGIVSDPKVRRAALGKVFGILGGFGPLLFLLGRGPRWGMIQFEAGPTVATVVAAFWGVIVLPALSGQGVVLSRPGLSQVLSGPATGRGLVLWWMCRSAIGFVFVQGLLLTLLATRIYPGGTGGISWGALVSLVLGVAMCASGLVATVAAWHHCWPKWARRIAGWVLALAALTCGIVAFRVGMMGVAHSTLPPPYDGLWLGLIHGTLARAAQILSPIADAAAAPEFTWATVRLLTLGAAMLALGLWSGRQLDTAGVFEASVRQAEAVAQIRKSPKGARRPARTRPFGRGVWALAWKAVAERGARHGWVTRSFEVLFLCGLSAGAGWVAAGGLPDGIDPAPAVIGFIAIGTIVACGVGGKHEAGLGTEILHRSWLLRYPVEPRALTAVLLGVPWLHGGYVLAVTLASAFWAAPAQRPLLAVGFAAGMACAAATRALRAWAWLRWPPHPGPEVLSGLVHAAASVGPLGIGAIAGTVVVAALHWPPVAGVAVAGMPAAVIAGTAWPFAVRALRRVEMK